MEKITSSGWSQIDKWFSKYILYVTLKALPVVQLSKEQVWSRLIDEIVGSNSAE